MMRQGVHTKSANFVLPLLEEPRIHPICATQFDINRTTGSKESSNVCLHNRVIFPFRKLSSKQHRFAKVHTINEIQGERDKWRLRV